MRVLFFENALHYFEDGQWKESRDVIESFPQGALAQYGPNKAIFSPDLNSESVFDVQTSDGRRLRGGVRSIQLTDLTTGRSAVLASLKQAAPGELLPPNQMDCRTVAARRSMENPAAKQHRRESGLNPRRHWKIQALFSLPARHTKRTDS